MFALLVLFGVIMATLAYFNYRRTYSFWSSRGVKGPTPLPFFGNSLELFFESYEAVDQRNWKKYGHVYGRYDGVTPILIVSKPEIVELIYFKNFADFSDNLVIESPDPMDMNHVVALSGENWKRVRSVLTKTMTSSKMKTMSSLMLKCNKNFIEYAKTNFAETGHQVNLHHYLSTYVVDIACTCFYSVDLDMYNRPNLAFLHSVEQQFKGYTAFNMFVMSHLPLWLNGLLQLGLADAASVSYMKNFIIEVVKQRTSSGIPSDDLLQTLIDAHSREGGDKASMSISDDELNANGIFMLAAAFDTTLITMSLMSWRFALNPEVQEKAYNEVISVMGSDKNTEINYEDVSKMVFLECCMNEALRMNAPVIRGHRRPVRDVVVPGTDIRIPKGTQIDTLFYVIHADPENFENPELFKPERFLPENRQKMKNCTFLPFGAGLRMCAGSRFAYLNVKQGMVELIRNFEFEKCDKTPLVMPDSPGRMVLDISPLYVQLKARK